MDKRGITVQPQINRPSDGEGFTGTLWHLEKGGTGIPQLRIHLQPRSQHYSPIVDSMLALCEHGVVNVISSTTIKRYAALHADAAEELLWWNKAASHAVWRDVHEVRLHFPDADQYKSLLIFNIRHNYYRLIVKVDYRAKLLMVKEFLTHQQYMRGGWKKWAR